MANVKPTMVNILAFCGPRYSGKSFCSSITTELDSRFVKYSFADIPKNEYAELAEIDREELDSPTLKERHRQAFIKYVEGKKEKDKAYWAKKLFKSIEDEYVVIDDLRFIEELEQVVKAGGVIYKVSSHPQIRKQRGWVYDARVDEHYSETEMNLAPYTFFCLTGGGIVYNNETETDAKLRGQLYKVLNAHFR